MIAGAQQFSRGGNGPARARGRIRGRPRGMEKGPWAADEKKKRDGADIRGKRPRGEPSPGAGGDWVGAEKGSPRGR